MSQIITSRGGGIKTKRGPIAQRPVVSAVPEGYQYFAEDFNGGQNWEKHNGVWVTRGPAVGDVGGAVVGYMEQPVTSAMGNWDAANGGKAGNTDVDLPALAFGFVSTTKSFEVEGDFSGQIGPGSAALPINTRITFKLWLSTDGGTTWSLIDSKSGPSKIAAGESYLHNVKCKSALIVPPANGTAYNVKATVAASSTGIAVTIFGRNNGITTSLRVRTTG